MYHALHEKNEIAQQQIQSQRQQQLQAHARSSSNRIQLYSPRGGDDKGDDGGMVLNKKIKAIDIISQSHLAKDLESMIMQMRSDESSLERFKRRKRSDKKMKRKGSIEEKSQ